MYFKFSLRKHPQTGKLSGYYRLVESYRNSDNRVCHHTILNVGFMEDVTPEQLNVIQKQLTQRYEHKQTFFQAEEDPIVKQYVEEFWQRIVGSKKLDLVSSEKLSRMVNMDTLQHSNAREIGAENIAYQTWEKLQLTPLLLSVGFTPEQAKLAATQVVSRAVYPASELKTTRWIKENSAVCELTGYDPDKVTKDWLYESALLPGKGCIEKCTLPNDNLRQIYNILQTKHQPFTKRKSVVHKREPEKTETTEKQRLLTG